MKNAAKTTQQAPPSSEPDRLAYAKNYADELNDSRLWKIKISYQKRWTKLKRARKAVEIQYTKPWKHASGPKTAAGKARSAQNAGWRGAEMRALLRAGRRQKVWIRQVEHWTSRYGTFRAFPVIIEKRLVEAGWDVIAEFGRAMGVPDPVSGGFPSDFSLVTSRNNE